jgi:DNA invertase Pin-like site-specific DNA recombinase
MENRLSSLVAMLEKLDDIPMPSPKAFMKRKRRSRRKSEQSKDGKPGGWNRGMTLYEPDVLKEMVRRFESGEPKARIAASMGINRSYIYQLYKNAARRIEGK